MMAAVSISETPVNFYKTTRRNIPEDSQKQSRRRENLKSHQTRTKLPTAKVRITDDDDDANILCP
jgi:hypothetical protein